MTSLVVTVLCNFAGTVYYFLIILVRKCPHLRENDKRYRSLETRRGVTILSDEAMPKCLNSETKFTSRLPEVFMLRPEIKLVGFLRS